MAGTRHCAPWTGLRGRVRRAMSKQAFIFCTSLLPLPLPSSISSRVWGPPRTTPDRPCLNAGQASRLTEACNPAKGRLWPDSHGTARLPGRSREQTGPPSRQGLEPAWVWDPQEWRVRFPRPGALFPSLWHRASQHKGHPWLGPQTWGLSPSWLGPQ